MQQATEREWEDICRTNAVCSRVVRYSEASKGGAGAKLSRRIIVRTNLGHWHNSAAIY